MIIRFDLGEIRATSLKFGKFFRSLELAFFVRN
jgi:hypothetical protein